jgi:hypothetical protein
MKELTHHIVEMYCLGFSLDQETCSDLSAVCNTSGVKCSSGIKKAASLQHLIMTAVIFYWN